MITDGTAIANSIYKNIKEEIQNMWVAPKLAVILVGDNPASLRYIGQKKKWAKAVGIDFTLSHLPENTSQEELEKIIANMNQDEDIEGFMIQTPLPPHINTQEILAQIHPDKDVDGFHPSNQGKIVTKDPSGLTACTPAGIIKLLETSNIEVQWKIVTVVGRSTIVGKPVINLLINAGATVLACNSNTPDISVFTKQSDIIISATGQPWLITLDMIQDHTCLLYTSPSPRD